MCAFLEEAAFLCSTHCCAVFTTAAATKPRPAQEPDFGLMGWVSLALGNECSEPVPSWGWGVLQSAVSCSLSLAMCSQETSCSPGPRCAGSADVKLSAGLACPWVFDLSFQSCLHNCPALLLPVDSGGGRGCKAGMVALHSREHEAGTPGELWLCSCRIWVCEGFAFYLRDPWSLAPLHHFCPSC